jgi:hypothetical protein
VHTPPHVPDVEHELAIPKMRPDAMRTVTPIRHCIGDALHCACYSESGLEQTGRRGNFCRCCVSPVSDRLPAQGWPGAKVCSNAFKLLMNCRGWSRWLPGSGRRLFAEMNRKARARERVK